MGDNPFADPSVTAAASGSSAAMPAAEAPSWLNESPTAAPAAAAPAPAATSAKPANEPAWMSSPAPAPAAAATAAAPAAAQPAGVGAPTRPPGDPPAILIWARVFNVVVAIALMIAAIVTIMTLPDVGTFFVSLYVCFFGLALCCFETRLSTIENVLRKDFGFMFSSKGRALFLLFVGFLAFSLGTLGAIVGGFMIADALFNFYVLIKFPEYFVVGGQASGEQEAQAYLAAHPELAQKGADAAIGVAANNPNLVKKGA
eukprot:CAMPEP_0182480570 /NCGR_PEP_ID=MMETSP1319-20130603/35965_1 /TAXON_ID=172717 /ORGANISM="Bolidomonas pacifica, Strain RCC208" /LENGTH=257 /DNA_ID=CAMNT_0024682081 /DNA_START=8 /DNA_END=778 /DNA_ORIENTATION=-